MPDLCIGRVPENCSGGHAALNEVEVAVLRERIVEASHGIKCRPPQEEIRGLSGAPQHLPLMIFGSFHVEQRPHAPGVGHHEPDATGDEVEGLERVQASFEPLRFWSAVCVAKSEDRALGCPNRSISSSV
jgi:hypothetical protein